MVNISLMKTASLSPSLYCSLPSRCVHNVSSGVPDGTGAVSESSPNLGEKGREEGEGGSERERERKGREKGGREKRREGEGERKEEEKRRGREQREEEGERKRRMKERKERKREKEGGEGGRGGKRKGRKGKEQKSVFYEELCVYTCTYMYNPLFIVVFQIKEDQQPQILAINNNSK